MAAANQGQWVAIPSELIGSIPRTDALIKARVQYESNSLPNEEFRKVEKEAIEQTIRELDQIPGITIVTDGEQTKHSFLTYPIYDLLADCYKFDEHCVRITFTDGHVRTLPRLVKPPFQYATYAHTFLDVAKKLTNKPIKQAVITASALSLVYAPHLVEAHRIENYSHEQFVDDLVSECEKDIRLCLEHGAQIVQLDFTEARLSLKIDPTGQLLKEFIAINNRVLDRFSAEDRKKLGVHVCPGGDCDCYHSYDVDYTLMLPDLFQLNLTNFYLQLSSEKDHVKVLKCIRKHLKPHQRIFVGVIDPANPTIETPDIVRDRVLEAAQFIPLDQLGTTDDCGFSPFADDISTPREVCFAKIQARIEGTKLAEGILNKN